MSLTKELQAHEIKLRNPKVGSYDVACPQRYCIMGRKPEDKASLHVEVLTPTYAEFKCSICLWTDKAGEREPESTPVVDAPKVPIAQATDGLPPEIIEYFERLKIDIEVVRKAGIKWDPERTAIGIPYRHEGATKALTYIEVPDLTRSHVSRSKPVPYGLYEADKSNELVIVQDEVQWLMLKTCGHPNVIALPNGGTDNTHGDDSQHGEDIYEYISNAADLLNAVPKVVLALDASPLGEQHRHELTRRIGAAKCYNAAFSAGTIAETLATLGIDTVCTDILEAKPCPILGLYELNDFERDLLMYFDGGMASGESTGFENVDRYYTVVPGQLTVITGMPNHGKSEWLDALTLNLSLLSGWRHAAWSPENGKEAHATKLIEKRVEMPADPKAANRMSRETYLSGSEWVREHYYFIATDSRKVAATIEWVLERARDAVLRYGIKGLIIDPFNRLRKSKDAPDNVDQYVSYVLDLVLNFAEQHGVHVWLVAHPKTLEADKKTKKYHVPSAYDISGGANFANMADNIIVIHRSEDIADATEIHVRKIRFKHVGKRTQIPPLLTYNQDTGRFKEPEEGHAKYSVTEKEIESIDP